MWSELSKEERHGYESKLAKLPDPVISVFSPDRYFGSVSERFHDEMKGYVSRNPYDLAEEGSSKTSLPSLDRYAFCLRIHDFKQGCGQGCGVGSPVIRLRAISIIRLQLRLRADSDLQLY